MNDKPNWVMIRNEYEISNISYRKLAKKYDVSFHTLNTRARREGWNKSRNETCEKVTTKLRQKSINKIVDINLKHFETWELLHDRIKETIKNGKVKTIFWGEIIETDLGTRDYALLARALKDLQDGQRKAKNIISDFEKQKLEIEKEKLLLKQKNEPELIEELEDDGFIEALNTSAKEVWGDEIQEDNSQDSI